MDASNPAEVFARSNADARIHDLIQFTLWAETPNVPGSRSRLGVSERNGAPRLTVFTGAKQGPKVLAVGMAPDIFELFMSEFETILKAGVKAKGSCANKMKDPSFEGKAANFDEVPKVIKNTLHYGIDEAGLAWLAVEQKDAARIVFRFGKADWHVFQRPDGTTFTESEFSIKLALAWVVGLRKAMANWTGRILPPWERPSPDANKPKATDGGGSFSTDGEDLF